MLDAFETFRIFAGGNGDERRKKSIFRKRIKNYFGKKLSGVFVSDDGAAIPEFQARAFAAQFLQKAARDFNFVAAISKLNGNDAHVRRIKIEMELQNKKPAEKIQRVKLVAGAGFEPAAFRL